eukprot:scaffold11905_cov80-Skeletonema_marinoi.AAC.1
MEIKAVTFASDEWREEATGLTVIRLERQWRFTSGGIWREVVARSYCYRIDAMVICWWLEVVGGVVSCFIRVTFLRQARPQCPMGYVERAPVPVIGFGCGFMVLPLVKETASRSKRLPTVSDQGEIAECTVKSLILAYRDNNFKDEYFGYTERIGCWDMPFGSPRSLLRLAVSLT